MKELTDKIKQIDRSIAELKRQRKKIEWQIEQAELAAIKQLKLHLYENLKLSKCTAALSAIQPGTSRNNNAASIRLHV